MDIPSTDKIILQLQNVNSNDNMPGDIPNSPSFEMIETQKTYSTWEEYYVYAIFISKDA